jgi:hypothetical protein
MPPAEPEASTQSKTGPVVVVAFVVGQMSDYDNDDNNAAWRDAGV